MIRVRVIAPDMFGFQGREDHPRESDIGVTGTVVAMDTHTGAPGSPSSNVISPDTFHSRALASLVYQLRHDDLTFTVLYVVTDDGRKLCLIDHEVEVLRA